MEGSASEAERGRGFTVVAEVAVRISVQKYDSEDLGNLEASVHMASLP